MPLIWGPSSTCLSFCHTLSSILCVPIHQKHSCRIIEMTIGNTYVHNKPDMLFTYHDKMLSIFSYFGVHLRSSLALSSYPYSSGRPGRAGCWPEEQQAHMGSFRPCLLRNSGMPYRNHSDNCRSPPQWLPCATGHSLPVTVAHKLRRCYLLPSPTPKRHRGAELYALASHVLHMVTPPRASDPGLSPAREWAIDSSD